MTYYQSNAVYKALEQSTNHPFAWVSGNAWMLVYGDDSAEPRLMVLAHGRSWKPEPTAMRTFEMIAAAAGLPVVRIAFDDAADSVNDVHYANGLADLGTTISLADLKAKFQGFGLPVIGGACGKSVNDATSSAYHNWQRDNLGAIKVTDVDLVRIDIAGMPCEIVELKRSYYALDKWQPFPNDFVNFNVLRAVAGRAGLRFTIAYNVRQKTPFRDDASLLSLFDYPMPNSPKFLGHFPFWDFAAGKY
ncbi:hypothetical protein [Burkholderia sp. LMG 21824]|uniref:hypothetical protein n=1 Tax=Burkholderia sp. LMG 21824 TaxID=3158172 RepID=UPI003C2CFDE3